MQMLDGLDDDLDLGGGPSVTAISKAKSTFVGSHSNQKKADKDEDEFDWGGSSGAALNFSKKKSEAQPIKQNNQRVNTFGTASFAGGQKSSAKVDDLEDWVMDDKNDSFDANDKGRHTGKFGGGNNINKSSSQVEGRSSTGSQYAGFGIMGKKSFGQASSGKKKFEEDEDDLLDNVLSKFEEQKGIETAPKPQNQRPYTADLSSANALKSDAKAKRGKSMDPWGMQDHQLDELDDLEDDNKSKKSAGINQVLLDKKKNLFGMGAKSQGRLNEEEQKEREYFTRDLGGGAGDQNMGGSGGAANIHKAFMGDMGRGSYEGSVGREVTQESGIEVMEGVLTRNKNQRRMAAPKQQTGRPPTGNLQSQLNVRQDNHLESMDSRLFSPQTDQNADYQNNLPPATIFQRPMTGQPQNWAKPPIQKGTTFSNTYDENDGEILGLLEDSKKPPGTASKAGSVKANSMQEDQFNKDLQYGINNDEDEDEDDDGGSLYLPTTIAKNEPEKAKKMSAKKERTQMKGGMGSMLSQGASGSNQGDNNQLMGTEYSDPKYPVNKNSSQINQMNHGVKVNGSAISQQTLFSGPMDEKQVIQKQIEEEKQKYKQVQGRYSQELDALRLAHKDLLRKEEERQASQLHVFNEEKRKLIEEMNKTIELEKEKVNALHRIDLDQREIQWKSNVENMKKLFEDQNEVLKKQLQQKIQMNQFAEDIQKSSGSISTLVQKISNEQESQLKNREDVLEGREKALAEKKARIEERRKQLDQKRKRLQQEVEEVGSREHETKLEYEREKGELLGEMERIEGSTQQISKELRAKVIELEVEVKRSKYDLDKLVESIRNEEKAQEAKGGELANMKRGLQVEREQLKEEMQSNERELKQKIAEMGEKEGEVQEEEREMEVKEKAFVLEQQKVSEEGGKLQEQVDQFCIDKEKFDREAQMVKAQAERDQVDSEKIGFFKANKERLKEELVTVRHELEAEKDSLKEDRVKLDLFKNELKTKQKAIESLRYEYIKSNQDKDAEFRLHSGDIQAYSIQENYTLVNKFYPINAPQFEGKKENVQPNLTHLEEHYRVQTRRQEGPAYVPRFNYDDYMRGLKDKLSMQAPASAGLSGGNFQLYLIKERETYMKSLHQFSDPALLSSFHYQAAGNDLQGSALDQQEASFNIGSLQNSQWQRNVPNSGRTLGNSGYGAGKNSANSLHFVSKNFGNTPVQENDEEDSRF